MAQGPLSLCNGILRWLKMTFNNKFESGPRIIGVITARMYHVIQTYCLVCRWIVSLGFSFKAFLSGCVKSDFCENKLDFLCFFVDERWRSAIWSKIFWRLFRVFRSFWHSSNCYYGATVYFCIANALQVLIHFDMLIREHYARNEIKWQHEVICLSLNWVFLAGGIFPPNFLLLHLDKLNARLTWHVDFFVLQCVMFFFGIRKKNGN